MKTWLFLAAAVPAMAMAEDVKLANGKTLRDVKVSVYVDGIGITLPGFGQTATKYPWSWIDPTDAQRLKDESQRQLAANALNEKLSNAGKKYLLRVIQVQKGAYLANILQGDESLTVLVVGSTANLVDDVKTEQMLYPTGRTYSYKSAIGATRKVLVMADSVDNAIRAREAFKEE